MSPFEKPVAPGLMKWPPGNLRQTDRLYQLTHFCRVPMVLSGGTAPAHSQGRGENTDYFPPGVYVQDQCPTALCRFVYRPDVNSDSAESAVNILGLNMHGLDLVEWDFFNYSTVQFCGTVAT